MTRLMTLSFVCFMHAAKNGAADLLLQARLRALPADDCSQASGEMLAPLSYETRTSILKRGPLRVISKIAVEPVAAIVVFAHAGEID